MYVIIIYDVAVERVNQVRKCLNRFLIRIQNSAFEGELTMSQIEELKHQLQKIIRERDSVIIYCFQSKKQVCREILGLEKRKLSSIL